MRINPQGASVSSDVEKFLARGGVIKILPGPTFAPYHEAERKPLPEWEERKSKRERERQRELNATGEYTQPQVMNLFDCPKTSAGYAKFIRMLEVGEIPEPDSSRRTGDNKTIRKWKRTRIDAAVQARKNTLIQR